jgi:hypothetical protein
MSAVRSGGGWRYPYSTFNVFNTDAHTVIERKTERNEGKVR